MSFFTSNRILAVAVLFGLGTACFSVPHLLHRVKDEAQAPEPEPPTATKRLQKDSENSLKIETLRTLADGYSHELRTSAIKIVASRTARSRTKRLLLRDLASKDYNRRDNAINGIWMLLYHPSLTETKVSHEFHDAEAAAATVCALIHVLPLHNINQQDETPGEKKLPPSPLRPAHRPAHEVSLLIILNNILSYAGRRITRPLSGNDTMEAALDAGLVTRWLARYPFPCALPENSAFNYKKSDVARLFDRMAWLTDDPLMADIVLEVMQYPRGRKEMREVGLQASRYRENVGRNALRSSWDLPSWVTAAEEDNDVRMVGGEQTAGIAESDTAAYGNDVAARPRSTERSQEEEHLRRRHREAIVVAERGAPLRRENILQRENSQVLQPMNGTSEVEGVLNGLLGLSDDAQLRLQLQDLRFSESDDSIVTPEGESRAATELDRLLDAQDLETISQESIGGPDIRRVVETLEIDGPVTLVNSGSTENSNAGGDIDTHTVPDASSADAS